MKYKLIGCDLDGTLFNSDGEISVENGKAIDELARLGVYFVPSSGRTFSDIPEAVRNHPSVRYIIHSNGAVVFDKQTGERISFCMPKELSREVLSLLFSFETHLSVRYHGSTHIDSLEASRESFEYYNVWPVHAELLDCYAALTDNFKSTVMEFDGVEMISAFFRDEGALLRVREILERDTRLNIVSACPYNLEITFSKADKGDALRALAEKLSIPINATIAVGDSENDISMIKAAGLGLAMKNAADKVKDCADETICHCDDHSVKFIKEKYIER